MHFQTNPQLEIAFEYVRNTSRNIFLTGRAGTGKTTFLHQIKVDLPKRMAIVAPTGVAAINAGGVTIHSLFQLPFGPILPDAERETRKFTGEKIKLLRSLDLLVIDEISMVRADVLDGIDAVLRRYKDPTRPFGGVQLLMIGDLHQLPPVVKDEEWSLLREHYDTAYFFGSRALQKTQPVAIELRHIYRQSDAAFIELLNKVRDNQMDEAVLAQLNSRFDPDFQPKKDEPYITLTAHNASAQAINAEKLAELKAASAFFKAEIEGDFPAMSFPTDEKLELKVGAQVMFVKNDPSKRFFNGKIGTVRSFGEAAIFVQCAGEANEIAVEMLEWENLKFQLDEKTKTIEEEKIGSFKQYPLKLAWAITIHKSQGLTFERAIIDAQASFSHGQVYVALSRCKSFEGMVLRSKIGSASVKTDPVVKKYNADATENALDEARLTASKAEFQQQLLLDLFDFRKTKWLVEAVQKAVLPNLNTLQGPILSQIDALAAEAEKDVFAVARKFEPQLRAHFEETELPETNAALAERLKKAAIYFEDKLKTQAAELRKIGLISDNKLVKKQVAEAITELSKGFFVKQKLFASAQKGFDPNDLLKQKANAELDFLAQNAQSTPFSAGIKVPRGISRPELYRRLAGWRDELASEKEVSDFMIMPTSVLIELSEKMPLALADLKKIKGVGAAKSGQFGLQILEITNRFAAENPSDAPPSVFDRVFSDPILEPKKPSNEITLALFQSGKTIDEIAIERGLARSTIEGHLVQFVDLGDLDIGLFLEKSEIEAIEAAILAANSRSSTAARGLLGERFSHAQIRMVMRKMDFEMAESA